MLPMSLATFSACLLFSSVDLSTYLLTHPAIILDINKRKMITAIAHSILSPYPIIALSSILSMAVGSVMGVSMMFV